MLSIEGACVDLAGIRVLRDVKLRLPAGSTHAIVGRNGAGKTTLLRALMGFVPLRAGRIVLANEDLATVPAHRRASRGVGYAPEERVLFPTMTVEENLRLPCEALRLDAGTIANRLEQALRVVPEVEALLPRSAAALSGGQGKMVALARAVMVGTHLILVDEPFQGLAPALARQYGDALSRLCRLRPGLCVVITESNQSLLDRVECQVHTLERGALGARQPEVGIPPADPLSRPAFA